MNRTTALRRTVTVALAALALGATTAAATPGGPAPLAPVPPWPTVDHSPAATPTAGTTPAATPTVQHSPTRSPSATPTYPRPAGACQSVYRTVAQWPGGFVGEVTVSTGNPISAWAVVWPADGATVQQVWGGVLSTDVTGFVIVRNAEWNGALPAGGTATFGVLGSGTPPTARPTCNA